MRNIVKICITLLMILVMAVPTFAADFVPSIGEKPSPEFEKGEIVDGDGNKIEDLSDGDIIITPIGGVDDADIPQSAKDKLKESYDELLNGDLGEIEGLIDKLKEALGDEADADDLTIRDLFDVTVTDPDILEILKDGGKLKVTFNVNIDSDEFLAVLVYVDGKWVLASNYIINADGTVTVFMDQPGPVAFLTAARDMYADGQNIPATGDAANVALWAGVGVVAAALLLLKRRHQREEN